MNRIRSSPSSLKQIEDFNHRRSRNGEHKTAIAGSNFLSKDKKRLTLTSFGDQMSC